MIYAFIQDGVVVGLSKEPTGIPDFQMVEGFEDFQKISVGDRVIDGIVESQATSARSACITKLQFSNRFTLSEHVAIETSPDPILKVLQQQQSLAEFIDLQDPSTLQGIGYLYNTGILTYQRMTEILTV